MHVWDQPSGVKGDAIQHTFPCGTENEERFKPLYLFPPLTSSSAQASLWSFGHCEARIQGSPTLILHLNDMFNYKRCQSLGYRRSRSGLEGRLVLQLIELSKVQDESPIIAHVSDHASGKVRLLFNKHVTEQPRLTAGPNLIRKL